MFNGFKGRTYESCKRKEKAAREEEMERRRARIQKHDPCVIDIESNGKYLIVEYVQNNGERVMAHFKHTDGWVVPPAKIAAEFDRLLQRPPRAIWTGKKVS
jgi:hypothetical protein